MVVEQEPSVPEGKFLKVTLEKVRTHNTELVYIGAVFSKGGSCSVSVYDARIPPFCL